jgi:hypothetical protein
MGRSCEGCGKFFRTYPCRIREGLGRFCGLLCRNGRRSLLRYEKDGYVWRRRPDSKGFILEHRFVMEKSLGRKLLSSEHVHHKNHQRNDNRLENLEISSQSEHQKKHIRNPVTLDGRSLGFCQALNLLNVTHGAAYKYKKLYSLSPQQTVEHYQFRKGRRCQY